ncbi:hypothetical protein MAPG_06027 [Magnaporthiopsis poae ATCC 64411]|uniref:Uncharacterized protein n=1 Tax=Magnaporthiopsis poae (strain ATCC 64411 / 73-15) TaxID=644358 RepID=A0A0C4E0Y5_MAGP6|nr:hypothetical protein MAPG_06027 [Magnaporthiopsis poae ATCC 64411]
MLPRRLASPRPSRPLGLRFLNPVTDYQIDGVSLFDGEIPAGIANDTRRRDGPYVPWRLRRPGTDGELPRYWQIHFLARSFAGRLTDSRRGESVPSLTRPCRPSSPALSGTHTPDSAGMPDFAITLPKNHPNQISIDLASSAFRPSLLPPYPFQRSFGKQNHTTSFAASRTRNQETGRDVILTLRFPCFAERAAKFPFGGLGRRHGPCRCPKWRTKRDTHTSSPGD